MGWSGLLGYFGHSHLFRLKPARKNARRVFAFKCGASSAIPRAVAEASKFALSSRLQHNSGCAYISVQTAMSGGYRWMRAIWTARRSSREVTDLPTLTMRAVRAISDSKAQFAPDTASAVLIPMIRWSESIEPTLVAEPCLAFDDIKKIPADCIVEAHGMKVAFAVPEPQREAYQDHVLDFLGDKFVFFIRGIIPFLEQT
jgi:hypothetical protein